MEVIIDDSFMLSCMRKRIDFIAQLEGQGYTVSVPREIMLQLKDLRRSDKASREDRAMVDAIFEILKKSKVKEKNFGKGKIEEVLIKKGLEGSIIGTTLSNVKRRIPALASISEKTGTIVIERKPLG